MTNEILAHVFHGLEDSKRDLARLRKDPPPIQSGQDERHAPNVGSSGSQHGVERSPTFTNDTPGVERSQVGEHAQ
jgi:hypothetical protein